MKPLYVQENRAAVRLDGPALKVRVPECADRRYPLRRVSRVISARGVDWETGALLACAERGITVSFLDEEGATLARCIGRCEDRLSIHTRLIEALSRPDWQERYDGWLLAMERMAVRSVCRRAGFAEASAEEPRALRRMFREGAASMEAVSAFDRVGRVAHGGLEALTAQELTGAGIDLGALAGWGVDLVRDLARILFWDFQLARLAWLEDRLQAGEGGRLPEHAAIIGFFEARRPRTERLCLGLILRLNRWLLESS